MQQVEGDAFIDSNGNIFSTDIYDTTIIDETSFSLDGNYYTGSSYHGDIIDGNLEYEIPIFLKDEGAIYKLTKIGAYTFWGSGLINITIPSCVTLVQTNSFYNCTDLKNITILNSETILDSHIFESPAWGETAWYSSQPDGIVYLGKILYNYKGSMSEDTQIDIKEGTVQIVDRAFYKKNNITDLTIPNTVKIIGDAAFEDCSGLTSITIPDSVINIPRNAFLGCDNLTTVNYTGTEEQWNEITIEEGNENLTNAEIKYNQ